MPPKKKLSEAQAYKQALQMVSPGTPIREAVSLILQSGTGGLLCFGSPKVLSGYSEGGVQIDAPTTPQLLYELCKMDGAIILNEDGSRIVSANRFLTPDVKIHSDETGTRHRTAMRFAQQCKCTVVAISERRSSVTLYVHARRHVMESIPTLLSKASQSISTLEKYISVLRQATLDLSTREFQDMVTIFDVCKAVQRYEMVVRIGKEIEPYILELGEEGRLISLQLKELIMPLEDSRLVIRDYYRTKSKTGYEEACQKISDISESDVLELGSISQALGYGANLRSIDTYLSPRGYRILSQTHRLTEPLIDNLVERFGSLQQIIRAPKEELVEVDGVGEVLAERIRTGLNLLRNQLALDRR